MPTPAGNIIAPNINGVTIAGPTTELPGNAPHGHLFYDHTLQLLKVRDENTGHWITFTPSATS